MSAELSAKAMLVTLTMRAWKGTVTDKELAQRTEQGEEAEAGTLQVIKRLTPQVYIKPIQRVLDVGRDEHYRMTVPGLHKGQHLLATKMYDRYVATQSELKDAFWERVNEFLEIYPEIVRSAPARLAGAYKESDFPTVAQIRTYFEYSLHFDMIPNMKDWRLDGIAATELRDLKVEAEDRVRLMFNNATRELFEKAHDVLGRIARQAKTYRGGPGSPQLRDASIENLKEIAQLIVSMNVTNDEDLAKVGYQMIEEFSELKGSELRKDADARARLAAAAERIRGMIPQ